MTRRTVVGIVLLGGLTTTNSFAQVKINAAGATFPYPIYSKWFQEFKKETGIEINYQSIGSGGGISQLTAGTVDFGASDKPLTDEQAAKMKAKVLHFPTVLGAVVPTYNLGGVQQPLNFTGQALAGIFSGSIKKWNDAAIKSANAGVNLPDSDIVVVHRSDGSGTTFVFTDYLAKVSAEFKAKVGTPNTSVNWPFGLGAKGNEGVAGLVKQTPNSIGYVELIYALQNKMGYGSVKNTAGKFVRADIASVTAAASGAAKNMPPDFRVSITNAPGPNAYPISTFTSLLVPSTISDSTKREGIKKFLGWMLTKGQTYAEPLGYAPLPKPVVAKEQKQIAEIK
jgi:phosphate transport system substrate-binding protein